MRAVLIGLVLLAAAAASAGEREERLEAGEVVIQTRAVKGSSMPMGRATILIGAPPERVWSIIDRCADYTKTMMRIKSSAELSRQGNKVRCKVTITMPFPLSDVESVTDATHTVVPGKLWKREWKQVEGGFRTNVGSWVLKPYGDGKRTIAIYTVHADLKVEVPEVLRKMAQQKMLRDLMTHLRDQVEPPKGG